MPAPGAVLPGGDDDDRVNSCSTRDGSFTQVMNESPSGTYRRHKAHEERQRIEQDAREARNAGKQQEYLAARVRA